MYEQNAKLKSQMSAANEKNRHLNEKLEKAKKAIAREKALNGPGASNAHTRTAHTSAPAVSKTEIRDSLSKVAANGSEANLLAIAQKLKKKLSQAEEQNKIHAQELAKYRAHGTPSHGVGNTADLEGELRDTKWKLQQLTVQHDALVSKTSSSGLLHRKQTEEYEESASMIRTLRKTLEELTKEKERSDVKADKCDELEQLVKELKASNRNLEESMERLCEAPFINSAYGQANEVKNYDDLLKERKDLMFKVSHLTEACNTHLAALKNMKMEEQSLREEKEQALEEVSKLRAKYSDMEAGDNKLSEKLKLLYGGDEGVTVEELERALTLVKRRGEHIRNLPFLDTVDSNDPATIKRKYQEVQVINLNLSKEVERLENMLKLQSTISKDLHRELESMVRKGENDRRDLIAKNNQLESLSMKRQEKIQMLEAQLRQHLYAASSSGGKVSSKGHPYKDNFMDNASVSEAVSVTGDIQNDLLAELINEKDGPVLPDENLMEVWVKSGVINEKVLPPGSSTFVVMDFFDYESQATSLVSGTKPAWDFAASFKIKVDDFLLRYFATDTIAFELNMAMKGDFRLLARCTLPLKELLRSKPKVVFDSCPMISPDTGEVICHLSIEMRLAIPISELYRLFLERHPTERRYIEELSNKDIIEGTKVPKPMDLEDESRLYNELEVVVLHANNLVHKEGTPMPCTYVYFQLLGYPDKFTNPVMDSTSPVFNERFGFPMITNDQQVRLLQRSTLNFFVMDIKKEEIDGDDSNGYMGEVQVSLASLGDGCNLNEKYNVKDNEGNVLGTLEVSLRWKNPFREQRELGPKALGAMDVERIMSAFSSGDLYTGLVDYRAFCTFINPPSQVKRALEAIRKYTSSISEKEKMKFEDVIVGFLGNQSVMDEDKFIERMMSLALEPPSGDYQALFRHIDTKQVAKISTDQVVAVLNMDEVDKIPTGLQDKLFRRTADMISRGSRPQKIFEVDDRWGVDGVISRTEFKGCLKQMGFMLVDEEEAPVGASVLHEQRQEAALLDESALSFGSSDEILHPSGGSAGEIADAVKKDKEDFQAKVAEATRRSKQAAVINAMAAENHENNMELPSKSNQERRMDHVEMEQPKVASSEHASGLSVADNGHRDYDKSHMDEAADTIKSAYKEGKRGVAEERTPRKKAIPVAKAQGILEYEDKLREQLSVNGARTISSLRDKFNRVDGKASGFVTSKQFFFVVNQEAALKLDAKGWKSIATYFDASGSLEGIDYKAFTNFLAYEPPKLLLASSLLDKMIFTASSAAQFRKCDSHGYGYISRGDMLRTLSELGYGHVGTKVDMQEMISLFESKEAGQVNYNNFIEYCRQTELSKTYDEVEMNLRHNYGSKDLNEAFQEIDIKNEGVITLESLDHFFRDVDYPQPKEILVALMANMDISNPTVTFGAFKEWITRKPYTGLNFEGDLTPAELKTKIKRYITLLQKQSSSFTEQMLYCFKHYDWRKPSKNAVTAQEFYRACKKAGFCFTESEIRYLATEFSTKEKAADDSDAFTVDYGRFMEWCFGGEKRRGSKESNRNQPSNTRHTTSDIIKFLENKITEGVNLIDVFREYDPKDVGSITADEFCLVMSSLGMSYLTQRDALDFSEYYKAAPGANYIMYKRIVLEIQVKLDDMSGAADVDIVDVICNYLLKKNVPLSKLQAEMERYDSKQRGALKSQQISVVFENCARIVLRRQEIESLSNRYADDNDTYWINYQSLLVDLKSRMGEVDFEVGASKSLHPEIVGKVRTYLDQIIMRGIDYARVFDDMVESNDGCILQADCKEVLETRLRIDLKDVELKAIYAAYRDSHDPRKMNYSRMLRDCNSLTVSERKEDIEAYHLADVLRQKIRRHCPDFRLPGALKGSYSHFCRKSRKITEDSFAIGAKDIGLKLDNVQTRMVFDMMKQHSRGQNVGYAEFRVFVCDPFYDDVMWKFKRKKKNSEARGITERDLINSIKKHESRQITSQQFLKALSHNDIVMSEEDVMRLMVRFDPDELQYFDVEEFVLFLNGDEDDDRRRKYGGKDNEVSMGNDNGYGRDMDESRAWMALRKVVGRKLNDGYTANEIFDYFDRTGRGFDLEGLREGAEQLDLRMSREDAREVIRKMTLKGEGIIDRRSFLSSLGLASADDDRPSRRSRRRYDDDDEENEDPRGHNRRPSHRDNVESTNADSVLRKFKKFLVERYASVSNAVSKLTAAFEDVDSDNDGLINTKQLKESFTIVHSDLGGNEAYTLFEKFDTKDAGKVRYIDIIDSMFTTESIGRGKGALMEIVKKLQRHMNRNDIGIRTLTKVFTDRDQFKEGEVNKSSFGKCVDILQLPLSDNDMDVIFADKKYIDYNDFLALLAPPSKESVTRIIAEIKVALEGGRHTAQHMKNAFRDIDLSGNGFLEKDEFLKAMRKLEIPIGEEKVDAIYTVYDADNNGKLDYQEFIDLIHDADLGSSTSPRGGYDSGRNSRDKDYGGRRDSRDYDMRSSRKSRDYDYDSDRRGSRDRDRDRDSYSSYRDERK